MTTSLDFVSVGSGNNKRSVSPSANPRVLQRLHASLFSLSNATASSSPPSPPSPPCPSSAATSKGHQTANQQNKRNQGGSPTTSRRSMTSMSVAATKKRQLSEELQAQNVHAILGLQANDIVSLLHDSVPTYYSGCKHDNGGDNNEDDGGGASELLLDLCQCHVSNITARRGVYSSARPNFWPREDLEDMANILQSFLFYYGEVTTVSSLLRSSPSSRLAPVNNNNKSDNAASFAATVNLPPCLLAKVHTTLGLLRQATWGPMSAIENLQKALWIRTKTTSPPPPPRGSSSSSSYASSSCFAPQEVGMAAHRLALAYGAAGKKDEARSLLQAALDNYQRASSTPAGACAASLGVHHQYHSSVGAKATLHSFMVVAMQDLERFQRDRHNHHGQCMSLVLTKKQKNWSSLPSLPIWRIDEDDDDDLEHPPGDEGDNNCEDPFLMMHSSAAF